ncbi:MAG: hypothetical protein J2P17_20325 [Mycobacterium sp.]|nr:hypothetical protein [Mycobacterium sp.]
MTTPEEQPRGLPQWVVRSHITVHSRTIDDQTVWLAEDDVGIVAMADSQDELHRQLHEMGSTR